MYSRILIFPSAVFIQQFAPELHDNSPLHSTVEINDLAQVKQLLNSFDVNVKDNLYKTPLHCASELNVDDSHFKLFEELLKRGADSNARDDMGKTPLHYLVERGNVRIIQLFLSYNADVSLVDTSWCKLKRRKTIIFKFFFIFYR